MRSGMATRIAFLREVSDTAQSKKVFVEMGEARPARIGTCMCDQGHAIQERKAPICALFLQC